MPNIKLTFDHPIKDGEKFVFRAPCDCSEVEGIKACYPVDGVDKFRIFTFRDAHGNDLTGLGDLFAEGVCVSGVLDTVNGWAFIQNADTNAYIEGKLASHESDAVKHITADEREGWNSKATIDEVLYMVVKEVRKSNHDNIDVPITITSRLASEDDQTVGDWVNISYRLSDVLTDEKKRLVLLASASLKTASSSSSATPSEWDVFVVVNGASYLLCTTTHSTASAPKSTEANLLDLCGRYLEAGDSLSVKFVCTKGSTNRVMEPEYSTAKCYVMTTP